MITQVLSVDKAAERAAFVQQMKDAWPPRCQDANERYITSLQDKLGVAEQKCADVRTLLLFLMYWSPTRPVIGVLITLR